MYKKIIRSKRCKVKTVNHNWNYVCFNSCNMLTHHLKDKKRKVIKYNLLELVWKGSSLILKTSFVRYNWRKFCMPIMFDAADVLYSLLFFLVVFCSLCLDQSVSQWFSKQNCRSNRSSYCKYTNDQIVDGGGSYLSLQC